LVIRGDFDLANLWPRNFVELFSQFFARDHLVQPAQ
jgi:hypothetical protein